MHPVASQSALTITNPLVLYRALLATSRIRPDPAQHRLAIHLQKLYESLKDYEPTVQYNDRLQQLTRAVETARNAAPPIAGVRGVWSSLKAQKERRDSLAVTRVLTSHEAAQQLNSPKGLLLHGEVGTGKSMLIDLFADCLPNKKKCRWHFNTFMLEAIARLEHLRQARTAGLSVDDDHSLLWLAKDLIESSPILFLDEFQLPDRASSKIMSTLMTSFFQLGGVLIATSNRMPEELANAAGMEFGSPPSPLESLRWRLGIREAKRTHGRRGEFAAFLDVLKARCDVWEMEGSRDYRRSEFEDSNAQVAAGAGQGFHATASSTTSGLGFAKGEGTASMPEATNNSAAMPRYFFVMPENDPNVDAEQQLEAYRLAERLATGHSSEIPWSPTTIRVYGREVVVPRHFNGVASWTFDELCNSRLGPADYITLASTFHTLILRDVPVLSLLQKNEARRFITLLDALYEARCKLLVTAEAGPDNIFFPETNSVSNAGPSDALGASEGNELTEDALHSETFAEAYQDAIAPFRPNVSSYEGPDHTHSRLKGILSKDALEDDPPTNLWTRGSSFLEDESSRLSPTLPDFAQTTVFTGEDERFAYKRARSRLWEMCGTRWWSRQEEGWWRPLPREVRRWEDGAPATVASPVRRDSAVQTEGIGHSRLVDEELDGVLFGRKAGSTMQAREPPTNIGWTHIWGTIKWGKRAGNWGKGVEGVEERRREKMRRDD